MAKAIQLSEFGGPEVLEWVDIEVAAPGPGEVRVRQTAVGLNFIDTYHRSGLYPLELPTSIGTEAAGEVLEVGEGVTEFSPGDRVAYVTLPPGSYCTERVLPAERLVPLPAGISDEQAAAVMLKGLTAWYLLKKSYPVKPGDPILLYAAAGGVGLLAGQWASALGAKVIGVTGSAAKAELALANGCAHVVPADAPNFVQDVRALTGGIGVAAVYDSVGNETFMQSLDCLRPHGVMVTYGNATGAVEPFAPAELAQRGSLYVTRPLLFHFIATGADLRAASAELFGAIQSGNLNISVNQTWPLAEAAEAHRALESRQTTGSTVLLP